MPNPTKIVFDCATGEQTEVEMEGDELAAYELARSQPEPPMPPTFDEIVAAAVAKALADRGIS